MKLFLSVFSYYLIDIMVGELSRTPQKLIHVYSGNQNLFFSAQTNERGLAVLEERQSNLWKL